MSIAITKPMLAASESPDLAALKYPLIASPKLDGIRCLKLDGAVLSRSFKAIPNEFIRAQLAVAPDGIDGELMSGANFQQVTGAVMRESGEPDFALWAFDLAGEDLRQPYYVRLANLMLTVKAVDSPFIKLVPSVIVADEAELLVYETKCLDEGFEGVMLRDPNGPYKCGRATLREASLLKLKRFIDGEAVIVGVVEMEHNNNEATTNELGRTARSSHKAGKTGAGTLGAFIVRDLVTGVEFRIGTGEGLDAKTRAELYAVRETLPGKIVKYKSQPHGVKDKPRIPSWQGMRDARDMS